VPTPTTPEAFDTGAEAPAPVLDGALPPLPEGGAYLFPQDALGVCSKIWACPRLRDSIQFSLAVFTGDVVGNADAVDSFSVCMQWLAGPIPGNRTGFNEQQLRLACIAQAATCTQALDCLPFVLNPPECKSVDGGFWCADGGLLFECWGNRFSRCTDSFFGPNAACDPSSGHCVTTAPYPSGRCQGSQQIDCFGGSKFGTFDCALVGLECNSAGECDFPGDVFPFAGFPSVRCWNDGGVALVSGHASQTRSVGYSPFDCSALGATCRMSDAGLNAYCAFPDDAFDPTAGTSTQCNGDEIQVCFRGSMTPFPCSSIHDGGTCYGAPVPHCDVSWPN
jgi:hypothetical protein